MYTVVVDNDPEGFAYILEVGQSSYVYTVTVDTAAVVPAYVLVVGLTS